MSDENDNGRSSFETAILVLREISTTAGSSMAVAPTLFISAESAPHPTMMPATSRDSVPPDIRRMNRPMASATPVLNSPYDTM